VPLVAILSFRLGGHDGVSIVAETWRRALADLGFGTFTVAGAGRADRLLPWLDIDSPTTPDHAALTDALAGADLVVVENVLSIPMNLPASMAVVRVLRGRPAVLHHHDPPWQRSRFAHITALPVDDPQWLHVTINRLTERQMLARGFAATTVANALDTDEPPGDRAAMRAALGVGADDRLALHPVRAIPRKNVPAALQLAAAAGATYWLAGPTEEGYGPELDRILAGSPVPVLRTGFDTLADAYAAADVVLYPSLWEGFGMPPLEAAVHRRAVAVGRYPVADELRTLGFRWLPTDDPAPLVAALADPATVKEMIDVNHELVQRHFSLSVLRARLATLLAERGWLP
jgi:mannosylglucosylglycerate synthase